MHGIEVTKESAGGGTGTRRAAAVRIRRISIRYADAGVMTFIPEAGEEFFSKDDVDRLVGILYKSSEALEWGQSPGGSPDPEQGRGLV